MLKYLAVVAFALVAVYGAPHHHHYHSAHDFAKWLQEIQKSHEFKAMTPDDHILYQQLVQAAETSSAALNQFIKTATLDKILSLVNHFDKNDIPHFEEYIAAHLNSNQLIIGRRQATLDLFGWMREMHLADKIVNDLPKFEKTIFLKVMYAAEHDKLTEFVNTEGYGPIFQLLAYIDEHESKEFNRLLTMHLEKEAAMRAMSTQTTMMQPSTPKMTASTPMMTASTPMMTASTPMMKASTPMMTASTPMMTASTPMMKASTPMMTASTPMIMLSTTTATPTNP